MVIIIIIQSLKWFYYDSFNNCLITYGTARYITFSCMLLSDTYDTNCKHSLVYITDKKVYKQYYNISNQNEIIELETSLPNDLDFLITSSMLLVRVQS